MTVALSSCLPPVFSAVFPCKWDGFRASLSSNQRESGGQVHRNESLSVNIVRVKRGCDASSYSGSWFAPTGSANSLHHRTERPAAGTPKVQFVADEMAWFSKWHATSRKKRWGGAAPFRIMGSFLWGCWKLGSRRATGRF